ncbi:MAG: hypothetical protein [Bacteriophage sp.]|nr:MAG: hypothetical protein [Bacteriophage sp.]
MQLKINNDNVELNFGVRFVRELDKVAGIEHEGVKIGYGIAKCLPELKTYDPAALSDVLYCATFKNSPRPGQNDIDDYLETLTADQLEKLFDKTIAEINKATVLKVAIKNMRA